MKKILESTIISNTILMKIKVMWFHFFFPVQEDTVYQNFWTTYACFCFYVMEFRKQKNIFCKSEASLCFNQKYNFCIMNKIKLVWFYSLYRNYLLSKNVIFLCILKIFFAMLYLKIFLEYWMIMYIIRISLCVTSP